MRVFVVIALLSAAICCWADSEQRAANDSGLNEVHVPEVGLTFSLPPSWVSIPVPTLEKNAEEARARAPNITYNRAIAGFQPSENPSDRLTFPYVLVQQQLGRPPAPDDLRAAAVKLNSQEGANEVTKRSSGLFTDMGSQISYDDQTNSLNGTMVVEIDGTRMSVYTLIMATDRGTVSLNGYYDGADRAAATKTFRPLFATARLDEAHAYSPIWGVLRSIDWSKALAAALTGAGLAAVFGRRKKQAPERAMPQAMPPSTEPGTRLFCTHCGSAISVDARFCGTCGHRIQMATPTSAPPASSTQRRSGNAATDQSVSAPSASGTAFFSYREVPWFRRQWFFWLMYFTISPIALTILISGDVYYQRDGVVKAFGAANRVIAGLLMLIVLGRLLSIFLQ